MCLLCPFPQIVFRAVVGTGRDIRKSISRNSDSDGPFLVEGMLQMLEVPFIDPEVVNSTAQ